MNIYSSTLSSEQANEVPVYSKRGTSLIEGSGMNVTDEQGKTYLDFVAGIGVANIGHCHPRLQDALSDQLQSLVTCPEIFSNPVRAELLEKLIELTPSQLDQVFLGNSGTEAIEAALKFSRIATGKAGIIAFMQGFHGRSFGSLSVTFNRKYRKPFAPLLPDVKFVPLNRIEQFKEAINDKIGAVIIELIQGNGGIHIADYDFVRAIRSICEENNILLIVDEIQTGIGRTGTLFAFEQYDIDPDILCLSKALGGGVPISATIVNSSKISVGPALHGSTFGGNPLACRAALTTLNIIEAENLLQNSREKGEYLLWKLQELRSPLIRDVRGRGLMIGIELRIRVHQVIEILQDRGILTGPAGSTVIRLLPPLTITNEQIDQFVTTLEDVLSELAT